MKRESKPDKYLKCAGQSKKRKKTEVGEEESDENSENISLTNGGHTTQGCAKSFRQK